MAGREISKQRLDAITAAYGADPERWPEPEREGARALLESLGQSTSQADEAARLDALLDTAARPQPSNMLKAHLLEDAAEAIAGSESPTHSTTPTVLSRWIDRIVALIPEPAGLRSAALGGMMVPVLVLGIWVGSWATTEPLAEEEVLAAFGEDYELWTEGELPEAIDMNGEAL